MERSRSQVVPWGQQCCPSLQHTAYGGGQLRVTARHHPGVLRGDMGTHSRSAGDSSRTAPRAAGSRWHRPGTPSGHQGTSPGAAGLLGDTVSP